MGIVIAQGVSTSKFDLLAGQETWQYMLLIPTFCCTILVLGLPACADSPSFLLSSRGEAAAEEALRWYRTDASEEAIAAELQVMRDEAAMGGGKTASAQDILRDPLLWKPILVGMFVNLSMQMSGIDAVLFYSTMVFEKAGIGALDAQVWTTAVGFVNVLVTIPAMLFMDKAGRKLFQSVGLGGMCCSYVVITFAMVTGRHMLAVYSMVTIIIFFAFGPGCIGWFIVAELTPIHARSFGTSLGLGANWGANWFVGFVFPHILTALGDWCFSVFIGTTFVLTVFTLVCVPETKGKTITEVSKFFASDRMLDQDHMLDEALLG
jgi:SP family facilitated glucose transporter-like MFS transporter 1